MAPFAHLGEMEKRASTPPQGLNDPFATHRPGWTWKDTGGLAGDLALGWNPFTGVPWFTGRAVNDFRKGNWGSGLMNLGFGALSFAPGGGSAGAALRGGSTALKAGKGVMPALKAGRGAWRRAYAGMGRGEKLMRGGVTVGGGLGLGNLRSLDPGSQGPPPQQNPRQLPGSYGSLPHLMMQSMLQSNHPLVPVAHSGWQAGAEAARR